jgi:phospholipid transport system substrate-binding protein
MRKILGVLSAIGMGTSLFVLPVQAAVRATDPATLIQAVTGEITEIVTTRTGVDRETAIRQLLQTDFDLPYMGSKALGTHWSQASEQQRMRFLTAVETSEARAYSERLGSFAGSTVTVGNVSTRPDGSWIVDSTLTLASGQPIRLEWEVHDSGQGLRIADVRISGVSMFMTRRADFNSYIQSHGGTVEPLVKVLEARAAH